MRTIDLRCPKCGAQPGERCRALKSRRTTDFHMARWNSTGYTGRDEQGREFYGMVGFLRARLDEDEARAQAALPEWDDESAGYEWQDLPDASFSHARWHNPGRALRDLEAKRAILAMHVPDVNGCCSICASTRDRWQEDWPLDEWPCQTVRHLTAEFSDHPDYQESWKP